MITAIASVILATHQSVPRVIERPETGSGEVILQAFVKAPDLTLKEEPAWMILGQSLLEGTEDFTKSELLEYGGQSGYPPRVQTSADFIVIEVRQPAEAADMAAHLLMSLLTNPSLRDEGVLAAQQRVIYGRQSHWDRALDPRNLDLKSVSVGMVRHVWERMFRPENTIIVASGEFTGGRMANQVAAWSRDWPQFRVRPEGPKLQAQLMASNFSGVSSFELRGDPLTPATPFSGARVLATIALGGGKDCTMWRVLRDQHAMAYSLEGIFWPTSKGWVPRFIMLRTPGNNDLELMSQMKSLMLADIETWDEITLKRAVAVAQASLVGDFAFNPFWLSSAGPMDNSMADRAAWQGFLAITGSDSVSLQNWAESLKNVSLETLQAQAKILLTEADSIYVRG